MQHQLVCDWRPAPRRGQTTVRALLTIEGEPVSPTSVPDLNVALVLDRSGSMDGEKLDAAKIAAAQLVQRMAPSHKASLVVFDDKVTTLAEGATAGSGQLSAAIANIESGGTTNLSGGWLMGRTLAGNARTGDTSVNRIILMTDGQANVGITDRSQLIAMSRAAAESGISTSTVGFGEGYDEDLLKAMADAGRGNAWYIERIDQAAMVFLEEIEGLLTLSAQNLTVTITGSTAMRGVMVWGDYPQAAHDDHLTVQLGDLYAREPRRLLLEFVVNKREATKLAGAVAQVKLEGDVMGADGSVTHQTITFPIAASLEASEHVEPTIENEVLLAQAAKARREAAELRERGDSGGAASVLHSAADALHASGLADDALMMREADELAAFSRVMANECDTEADLKYLKQRAYNRSRGRARYDDALSRPVPSDDE